MPKNEFICKFGVCTTLGLHKGHKNPQVNAAYHDYAHLIPIKLLFFQLKKFHSVEFSLFEKKNLDHWNNFFSQ